MKNMQRFLSLLLAALLALSMPVSALAAEGDPTVEYTGQTDVFEFSNVSSGSDLFKNFKGVMPGDMLTQTINIKNSSEKKVRIYLRMEPTDTANVDFLEQLRLKVVSGSTLLYEAPASVQGGLAENVLLGVFEPCASIELNVDLIVPIEMDDAFEGKSGDVNWVFTVEEDIVPTGATVLILNESDTGTTDTVWVDGVPYTGDDLVYADGKYYVTLPDTNSKIVTVYTYSAADKYAHTTYPTHMRVLVLTHKNGTYSARRISALDDLLQYAGTSIRLKGTKGIRMITAIDKAKRTALMGSGLAGFKLYEYGTVLAQREKMTGDILRREDSYARWNYAYRMNVADPIFAKTSIQIQYTNVLVGFKNDQLSGDIAMRPYIVLTDAAGEKLTIYGGIVNRSIGYVARQNRNTYEAGTVAYNYVWDIIRIVYGEDFQG